MKGGRTDFLEASMHAIAGRHKVLDVVEAGEVSAKKVEESDDKGGREGGRGGNGEWCETNHWRHLQGH